MSTRIILVDDNNLFRQGLRTMIAAQSDFEVVADMRGGREAVQAAIAHDPHLILMDIVLSGINGLEIVPQLKRRLPNVRILMLTSLRTDDYVREALRVGTDGYMLKDATLDELLMAMRSVALGKKYLSPDVSSHLVNSFLHPETARNKASRLEILTTRERSILQLIAEGRTNRTAAEFLSVSPKTVEKHRANLMHKLGLRNAAELTLVALELGLIERPFAIARLMGNTSGDSVPA
jgi:DNA-binding NarL/FixJ family response regulator